MTGSSCSNSSIENSRDRIIKRTPIVISIEKLLPRPGVTSKVSSVDKCELNIFETQQEAMNVNLVFVDLVLTRMLKGKKVMHLFDKPGFDYLPGESVIVPPNEMMKIDFPEAKLDNPTQCIALSISKEMIENTFNMLNEKFSEKVLTEVCTPKVFQNQKGKKAQIKSIYFLLRL